MPNVRDYLRKKAERKEKKPNTHNFGDLILKHRMAIITRTLLVLLLCAGLGATIYVQLKKPGIQQLYNPVLHRKTAV